MIMSKIEITYTVIRLYHTGSGADWHWMTLHLGPRVTAFRPGTMPCQAGSDLKESIYYVEGMCMCTRCEHNNMSVILCNVYTFTKFHDRHIPTRPTWCMIMSI